ncbi:MAG TPA: tRNA threonylcarbamoyladenosine dehydratase [Kiritimatiellia bacterium]|nr:tRNA threonylcarbamoyladenosine dehydratase [Kiritimatiellia bacterium]HPS07885.1 tRNA threonylcarbamoyladenosine dehydratase [Kiritimatiellia bacterium]
MHALSRTELLLGRPALEKLRASRVAVFGIGGVGSFTAEALARSGLGRFLLVDDDLVCLTNINRQLIALHSTVGRPKVDVMAERIRDINPQAEVEARQAFYLPENADAFDLSRLDYIVDAVDTVSAKVELAVRAHKAGIPLVSCMGAGNKLDPTRFEVADLFTTSVCPLCKVMRKELKARGLTSLKVVYSKEPPVEPAETDAISCRHNCVCPENSPRTCTVRRRIPGSVAFVPSVAGLILAGVVVRDLIAGRETR